MGRERSVTPRGGGGDLLPVGSHRYQIQNFHVKDGIPVLECWIFGDHILPSVFRLAILWFFSYHSQEGILLWLSQRQSAHLVGMSCPSYVGCFEDGVGCARECDTGLGHCIGPSLGLQVDHIMSSTLPFQHGVHRTWLHTYVIDMCLKPVPLNHIILMYIGLAYVENDVTSTLEWRYWSDLGTNNHLVLFSMTLIHSLTQKVYILTPASTF